VDGRVLRPAMTVSSLVVIAGRRPGNPPRRLSPSDAS
jgi:hypothetical protein